MSRRWRGPAGVAALWLAAGGVVALRFEVTTSITHFLGSDEELQQARLSQLLAGSARSRSMAGANASACAWYGA